ncbi:MAG TPA: hypothetical protein VER79_10550 [Candidatus Limnocylindrales bacterium]|nr:hypothetical protein [Candidatus Limnocylindrales bacterium]
MVQIWRVGLSLMIAVILFGVVGAQEPEPTQPRPLLMSAVQDEQFITGLDLYRANGSTWEAVTTDGYKGGFRLSPTGFIMTYRSMPEAVRTAVADGAGWLAGAVWDLQLLDLTTDKSRPIAAQPPTFAVTDDGQITDGVTRSRPVWSPEGTALAWTEQDYPASGGTARLLTYDLVTGETRVLDESLPQVTMSANGLPTDLAWGHTGLVVFTNDPDSGVETLRFYDPNTGMQQSISVSGEPWRPVSGLLWVNTGDAGEQVIVQAGPWLWWRVNPATAEVNRFCGALEGVCSAAPDESLRLIWDTALAQSDGEWRIVAPDGAEVVAFDASRPLQYAPPTLGVVLSPDGSRAAYPEAEAITAYDMGEFTTVDVPAGLSNIQLYWGWAEWRSNAPTDLSCAVG